MTVDFGVVDPRRLDRRLVVSGPLGRLVLLRVLLSVVIGLRLLLRRWWVLDRRPDDLFLPVPVLSWMSAPPGSATIWTAWAVGVLAVLVTVFLSVPTLLGRAAGPRSRVTGTSFALAWASLVFLTGLWGSSGKILHNDILLITACVPVLLAPVPRPGLRTDHEDPSWGWPPRAALAVIGTVYFLTGFQKLRHSGLEWVFSSNMSWVIRQGNPRVGDELSRSLADHLWLTQALAAGALLLELTAPVVLAMRRSRLLFALGATVMHLSIWALLGLDYYGWVLAVWAVVLPMSTPGDHLWSRGSRRGSSGGG